jgi:hypothetical protein
MKKLILIALVGIVTATFALGNVAFAQLDNNGKHFNLNIIGFAQCTKSDTTDPDCFKGNAGDIQTSGHTIFVPLKTAQTENICATEDSIMPTEMFDTAWLQKGVRILVSDAGGEDIQVIDRDATDGTAQLNLPDGCYVILARALGKPGGCMDIDTVICYDEVEAGVYEQVSCSADLTNDKYVVVGHLNVDRIKGVKPHWVNATPELLPVETGVGTGDPGYFDFFWQIFNDNLRLLQLRIYQVDCPES